MSNTTTEITAEIAAISDVLRGGQITYAERCELASRRADLRIELRKRDLTPAAAAPLRRVRR